MSRVSSWDTKHRCISAFFSRYPTPTAFLEETDRENVRAIIRSLGLFDDRMKSLAGITNAFLLGNKCAQIQEGKRKKSKEKEEEGVSAFSVDLKENKIRHIEELGFTTGTFVTILEAQLYGKEEDTDWTREPEAIQAYVCVCASQSAEPGRSRLTRPFCIRLSPTPPAHTISRQRRRA